MRDDEALRWLWPEACAMVARAERLHRQFFHIALSRASQPAWEPPADVLETPNAVLALFGLPGVDPESIIATLEGETLVVTGNRMLPRELQGAIIHRMELPHGRFERKLALPHGRYRDARSTVINGCLVVTLDKII
jgi:HSP20 family molecular chaperone IbpA